jgi:hypothetical protein
MPADHDDFIRKLAAPDLADHVRRFGVGVEMRIHLQADDDLVLAVGHALQAIGVFS